MYTGATDRRTLAKICSEIVHVQPPHLDHSLSHAKIVTVFFSEMEKFFQQQQRVNLYPTGGYLNFSMCFMKKCISYTENDKIMK
jgi:hypothetical protein